MTDFTQAIPDIPCLDRWPPGALTEKKAYAYQQQRQAGNINHLRIDQDQDTGITVVEYLSNCPQDWLRQQLSGKQAAQPAGQIMMEDMG